MTARKSLEEALEFLLNEDEEQAHVAFHNFIVKSAQTIHESFIAEDDLDNDIDESDETKDDEVNEAKDTEEVDEAKDEEIDESKDKEEVDEGVFDRGVAADEYFGRDELTTEMDDDYGDDNGEEMGDVEASADLGDEMGGVEGEEVTLDASDVEELTASLSDLQDKFNALVGGDEGDMDMDAEGGDMEMDMDMDMDAEGGDMDYEEPAEEGMRFESKDEDLDEKDDSEEVDEAITHEPGVAKASNAGADHHGHHGKGDSVLMGPDAKLPEGAEFDFDLTEEDFLDLEEGLKQVDVKMGGEQGGGKFAGEETQTKSPVAQRDKSDIKAGSKDMISKRDDHSGYSRESEPTSGSLPHSEDNSKDKASTPTSVSKGGGLEKQSGYGEGEVGSGKFAGQETNVKSPIGSAGTRNES